MSPLVWTGITIAAALGLLALWAWLWPRRIRSVQTFEEHTLAAMDLIHDAVLTDDEEDR